MAKKSSAEETLLVQCARQILRWLEEAPIQIGSSNILLTKDQVHFLSVTLQQYIIEPRPGVRGRTPFDSGHDNSGDRRREWHRQLDVMKKQIIAETGKARGAKTKAMERLADETGLTYDTWKYRAKASIPYRPKKKRVRKKLG